MAIFRPSLERFRQLARQGNLVPIYRQLMSDQLTPVLAYRRLVKPDDRMAPSFLLESVVGGERIARYSFMGAQPLAEIIAHDRQVTRRFGAETATFTSDDPLKEMARLNEKWKLANVPELPDFTGGWVGYAGYDTVRYAEGEKLDAPPTDDRKLPDLHMGLYRQVVAFDHVHKMVLAINHVLLDEHASVDAAYEAGCRRARRVRYSF
jgi:anthranilate synthase component 1